MNTETFFLPAHWACAFINGDTTGLDDDESKALDRFELDLLDSYGTADCIDVSDETEFMSWHDARTYGVLACDVAMFTFIVGDGHGQAV